MVEHLPDVHKVLGSIPVQKGKKMGMDSFTFGEACVSALSPIACGPLLALCGFTRFAALVHQG